MKILTRQRTTDAGPGRDGRCDQELPPLNGLTSSGEPLTVLRASDIDTVADDGVRLGARDSRRSGGFVASVILHILVLMLAVFGWPWSNQAPPPPQVVPLNLVQLADSTAAPSAATFAPVPQEKAAEASKLDHPEAVPVTQAPAPQTAERKAEDKPAQHLLVAAKPAVAAKVLSTAQTPKRDAPASAKHQTPSPADDLATRLEQLSHLQQTTPLPTAPRQQEGSGSSNVTADSANAGRALTATYSVRDFIRAQVERRWNLNNRAVKKDWVVSIHIVLLRDGRVARAEIVDEPRYHLNRAYFDFALSARNAVLVSSPLAIPAGDYDIAKDIVIEFDPKRVLQ